MGAAARCSAHRARRVLGRVVSLALGGVSQPKARTVLTHFKSGSGGLAPSLRRGKCSVGGFGSHGEGGVAQALTACGTRLGLIRVRTDALEGAPELTFWLQWKNRDDRSY